MQTQRCLRCNQELPLTEFARSKTSNRGHRTTCIMCQRRQEIERKKLRRASPCEFKRNRFFVCLSKSATQLARAEGMSTDITFEYVRELFDRQNGRCAISNAVLDVTYPRTYEPDQAALDRIDNTKGWVCGNVQITTSIIAEMCEDYDHEEFYKMCQQVVEHRNRLEGNRQWTFMKTDETRMVEEHLRRYFPNVDAYRYNNASIRIRVVDSRFKGLYHSQRDDLVEPYVDLLPTETKCDIIKATYLYPGEVDEDWTANHANQEFERAE